jgi:hypothetical protein
VAGRKGKEKNRKEKFARTHFKENGVVETDCHPSDS